MPTEQHRKDDEPMLVSSSSKMWHCVSSRAGVAIRAILALAPTAKPVATPTPAPATPTPTPQPVVSTPEPQPSQSNQAEIDATNVATAQFKLDMLTSDIASDIRSEDKNQVFLYKLN